MQFLRPTWQNIERAFLLVFLLTHYYLFSTRLGVASGWDAGPLLGHMGSISWSSLLPPIDSGFYSYHPPLGFLLFRTVQSFGLSDVIAVQTVSFSCSILAFFAIRRVLRVLHLLHEPLAIAFLYIAFSIPLVLSLATTLNLDSLLLLLTCTMLLLCVHAFVLPGPRSTRARMLYGLGMAVLVVLGLLIKFSGLLLTAIPVITALCGPDPRRNLPRGIAAAVAAIVFIFPFYYTHYYLASGTFFPHNADLIEEYRPKAEGSRAMRDADRLGFFLRLVTPAPGMEHPGQRDYTALRYSDTWRDVWTADTIVFPMTEPTTAVAAAYLILMPIFFLLGVIGVLLRAFSREKTTGGKAWKTLGCILLGIGLVQCAALFHFTYSTPMFDWRIGKAIYIVPAMLPLAFVLAHSLVPLERLLKLLHVNAAPSRYVLMVLVAAFLLVNHLVPVY